MKVYELQYDSGAKDWILAKNVIDALITLERVSGVGLSELNIDCDIVELTKDECDKIMIDDSEEERVTLSDVIKGAVESDVIGTTEF